MDAPLFFIYKDAGGFETKRKLEKIISDSEVYFKGIQEGIEMPRTFKKERVVKVLTEVEYEESDLETTSTNLRREKSMLSGSNPSINYEGKLEIAFTGFKKDLRADYEQWCEDNGLFVRKDVTSNLSLLVGGPNAGPTKLKKAYAQGVQILDEADFLWLIETGELPD